jgi:hypothetical protein
MHCSNRSAMARSFEKEIVDDIVARYSTSVEEVKRDLARLIRELVEKGLLVED